MCNRHAHQMLDMGDGLGISILYRVVVRQEIQHLSRVSESSKTSSALADIFGGSSLERAVLPEPGSEEEAEERYLRVLLEGSEDGSLRDQLLQQRAALLRALGDD